RAEHRRDVMNLIAAARCGDHVVERRQLSDAHVDSVRRERPRRSRISHQRAHVLALRGEPPGQAATREAGGASDENGACHGGVAVLLEMDSRAGAGIVPRPPAAGCAWAVDGAPGTIVQHRAQQRGYASISNPFQASRPWASLARRAGPEEVVASSAADSRVTHSSAMAWKTSGGISPSRPA